MANDPVLKPPFDDRHGMVTPAFYQRLRELRELCGGWLYWSDEACRVVFAPDAEWERVRAARVAAAVASRQQWEESIARSERKGRRLTEVMALARADAEFWNTLKAWEIDRHKMPSNLPKAQDQLAGPIRVVTLTATASAEAKRMLFDRPVDPVFSAFIERIRKPDDKLSPFEIMINLRGEIRRELGLTGPFS